MCVCFLVDCSQLSSGGDKKEHEAEDLEKYDKCNEERELHFLFRLVQQSLQRIQFAEASGLFPVFQRIGVF